jgi:predicted ATPase
MPFWTIDLEAREVRDATGAHAALRRRNFELLLSLARRHDQVVSKDELIAENWHGLAVTDDSLTKSISEIRQRLGPGLRDTLRTFAGRGYMLTGWQVDRDGMRLTHRLEVLTAVEGLPAPRPLVGRTEDIGRVTALLGRERLVTLCGSGGVGKTSLAIAAANAVAADFADGAVLVSLASLLPGGSIAAAILAALRIETSGEPLRALLACLEGRRRLLVLDNCEHVIEDVAALVARLLAELPAVTVLTTSRERLAIERERVFRVATLPYPPRGEEVSLEAALRFPAIQLVGARAGLVVDGYRLSAADLPAAVEICARLDGIPLAIILACARLSSMSFAELALSLDRRFELLTGGGRDTDTRQRTLRAMVAWSVDLLGADERALFAELGVFAGAVLAEDILATCRIDGRPPTLDLILALVDKSLLNVYPGAGGPTRYGYFETTRHFALDLLGEGREVRRRHAAYMVELFRRGEAELETTSTGVWRAAYAPYLDNLRAALEWCFAPGGDLVLGAELVARGVVLFEELSLLPERRAWVERAESCTDATTAPAILGRLKLWHAARTSWVIADDNLSRETAALFARSGEPLWEGRTRAMAAASEAYARVWEGVWSGFDAAEALLRPLGDTRAYSNMLRYKATALIWSGRLGEAAQLVEQAIRMAEAIGYFTGAVRGRATFGEIAFEEEDWAAAIDACIAEVAEVSAGGSLTDMQIALTYLAAFRLIGGEVAAAGLTLREALAFDRKLGDLSAARVHIELTGFYLALRGDLMGAAALTWFAHAVNEGARRDAERFEEVMRQRMDVLLGGLAPEGRREAEAAAALWSFDQAVAIAIEKLSAS